MSHFIQLTNVLNTPEGPIEEPIAICVENIQWYKDQRVLMINSEVVVKENRGEIWNKIYMATKH